MKDIANRKDIEKLLNHFYQYVSKDELMSPFFDMNSDKWNVHLERTCNFWENWLFQTGNYHGGLMWAHIEKNQSHPITSELFEHWLAHWYRSIDDLHKGPKADFLKSKGLELGKMMNARLNS